MSHIAFDESFMSGFGAGNRTPDTSRVERKRPKVAKMTGVAIKGLSRASVSVVRLTPKTYEVRVKGNRKLVGLVNKYSVSDGKSFRYSFAATNGEHAKDFSSQKDAVAAMLGGS